MFYESIIIFKHSMNRFKEAKDHFVHLYQTATIEYTKDKEKPGYAEVIDVDEQGVKPLAYPLGPEGEKVTEGYYVIIKWKGTKEDIQHIERLMRMSDHVLKFLNVRLDTNEELSRPLSIKPIDEILASTKDKSEQVDANINIDAEDVLLGLAKYTSEGGDE